MDTPAAQEFREWLRRIGAKPFVLDPAAHDRIVSYTSHLAQLSSTALGATVAEHVADDEMLQAYDAVQQRMIATGESWQKVPIPVKLYDAVRKLYPESRPPFRARCFDVQLIGGLVLYEGKIEATGEHRELLNSSELYRHLQYMEFNEYAGSVAPVQQEP